MDALLIANLSQRKSSSRIASATDEDTYYRQQERRIALPSVHMASLAAAAGLVFFVINALPA